MGRATTEAGRALVVWGGGSPAPLRAPAGEGAVVVAWPGAPVAALQREGLAFRTADEVVGAEGVAAVEAAGRRFARIWGRLPLAEGKSFHELVAWRGASLLWCAEAFLREETAGARCARTAERALRLLEAAAPVEVDACGLTPADAALLARACTARGVLFHGPLTADLRPLSVATPRVPAGLGRLLALSRAPAAAPALPAPIAGRAGEDPVLAIVAGEGEREAHAPLWGTLAAGLSRGVVVVTLGELPRWETRRVHRAAAEAREHLRACGRRIRGTPGLVESYVHRGVRFADLAAGDLDALVARRLPAAARLVEIGVELLSSSRPAALVVCVPSSDARRALIHAGASVGVPSVVLLAEGADPIRADGGPQPDAALPWGTASSPDEIVARLREAARGRVEPR